MRAPAVLLCVTGAVACSPPSGAPAADAGALDAGHVEVADASPVETAAPAGSAPADAAPADAAPPRRSCGDLTPDEKRSLEDCAYDWVRASLGVHGRRTVLIEVGKTVPLRVRTDKPTDTFSTPLPGSTCARTGELLAPLAPCTWEATGPAPSWTIRVVKSD